MGTLLSLSKSTTAAFLSWSELALLLFGLLLVAGLWGEYLADHKKKEYPFFKKRKRWFEIWVIIGVAGELIADGGIFVFSSHLQTISDLEVAQLHKAAEGLNKEASVARLETRRVELQIMQITNNVASIDPLNQPIRSIEAHVSVSLSSTKGFKHASWLSRSSLDFDRGPALTIQAKSSLPMEWVPISDFSTNSFGPNEGDCSMHFRWPSAVRLDSSFPYQYNLVGNGNLSMGEIDKKMSSLSVPIPCSGADVEITSGTCSIIFNGAFERRFQYLSNSWVILPKNKW